MSSNREPSDFLPLHLQSAPTKTPPCNKWKGIYLCLIKSEETSVPLNESNFPFNKWLICSWVTKWPFFLACIFWRGKNVKRRRKRWKKEGRERDQNNLRSHDLQKIVGKSPSRQFQKSDNLGAFRKCYVLHQRDADWWTNLADYCSLVFFIES